MNVSVESFVAGFAYGGTTVLVGQPLDTIKTLAQTQYEKGADVKGGVKKPKISQIASELYRTGGIKAFYRGGVPLLLGGGLMRSTQFGVYHTVISSLRDRHSGGGDAASLSSRYYFGFIDPDVVVAGFCGGIGRGLVEGPFEMVKVRRQVASGWQFSDVFRGFGTTMLRNSFLFAGFVVYMDIFKQALIRNDVDPGSVAPFWKAGTCANLAWLTIWPLDVVKTRRQSGRYDGRSVTWLLADAARTGQLYRGLGPGLLRSFVANGASMEVYAFVEKKLKEF